TLIDRDIVLLFGVKILWRGSFCYFQRRTVHPLPRRPSKAVRRVNKKRNSYNSSKQYRSSKFHSRSLYFRKQKSCSNYRRARSALVAKQELRTGASPLHGGGLSRCVQPVARYLPAAPSYR